MTSTVQTVVKSLENKTVPKKGKLYKSSNNKSKEQEVKKEMKDKSQNPFTGIAGTIGGTTIAMIALIVIFASEHSWVIVPLVFFMTLFGIMLGKYASKRK